MIWPSSTSTFDSIARRFVMIPEDSVVLCTLETSWKICIRTVPDSEIVGFTCSVVPTSRRSIVWNGFTAPVAAPVFVNWPVMKGTFWPMMIRASSLSSVSRLGVARMFASALVSSARARKPRFRISPIPGTVTVPRTTPRFRPSPMMPGLAATSRMFAPAPRGDRLVPPITRVEPCGASRNCHCTPSSAARSALISTISDSM